MVWYDDCMEFSVLQWNVWFDENIENVLKVLQENKADFICLQELTRGHPKQTHENTWEYLANALGYEYHLQEFAFATWTQANAVFTRFEVQAKAAQWVNEPSGKAGAGYDDEYRAYAEVTAKIGDTEVTVATTHLSYTKAFEVLPQKFAEAQRLTEIFKTKTGPYIFTGDCNAQPDSSVIAEILKSLQHAGPNFSEKTWTTKPFSYEGFEATTLDWRLDYVFYKDLKVVSSEILKTDVSDHLPVLATFVLP